MPEGGFGWNVLSWAWGNRGEILGYLKKVREWFRSDPGRGILIIGAGGVGKTTLARILSGEFDWLLDEPWKYEESYGVEETTLKDDPKVKIVVPPGQPNRREAAWADVGRNLAAGKYRGVIVVNANGYHTMTSQSYKTHRLYAGNKAAFLTAYVAECRTDESAILNRVAAAIQPAAGKVWLLSVVAKEDLWWPDRNEVAAFYTSGGYAAAVAQLAATKGNQDFRHEVVAVSLLRGHTAKDRVLECCIRTL